MTLSLADIPGVFAMWMLHLRQVRASSSRLNVTKLTLLYAYLNDDGRYCKDSITASTSYLVNRKTMIHLVRVVQLALA